MRVPAHLVAQGRRQRSEEIELLAFAAVTADDMRAPQRAWRKGRVLRRRVMALGGRTAPRGSEVEVTAPRSAQACRSSMA